MSASGFAFRVTHLDGAARRGVMTTAHGDVDTPAFMPVGTQGAVKGLTGRDVVVVGAGILLANTYHLYLRPGDDLIARRGGLHRFIAWKRPILTDSGGYQVFSLAARCRIDEEGARFRSHLDGSPHLLTSDIAMALDQCLAYPAGAAEARASTDLTLRWARRARARMLAIRSGSAAGVVVTNPGQAQFGIVQGSVFSELRAESARETAAIGFEAYAIGGLSVGEPTGVMYDMIGATTPALPSDRPRYLMGTGTPEDLVESVARGVDLFDCVLPTRNARNGQLFTSEGKINIKNARYAEDDRPLGRDCACYTCRTFSRAYLRHLFLAGEMSAGTLNTLHNLYFYLDTMRRIREAIALGRFESFRLAFRERQSGQAPPGPTGHDR
jgi:queuine tRNA-ribosyltransferase